MGRTVRLVLLEIKLLALENALDILDFNDWFGLSGAGADESCIFVAILLSGPCGASALSGTVGLLAVWSKFVPLFTSFFSLSGFSLVIDSRL